MAKYSNVVEYSIITDVDTSGVTKLQNELTKLKQSLKNEPKSFNRLGLNPEDIDKSIQKINQLQTALTKAFNAKIGTLDLSKLNASLQQEHSSLQMIARDWEQMGSRGKVAISSLSSALLSMNSNAVTINTTLSKMANTFGNTVRWGITAGIFQEMVSSVQGAVSYMKDLDESLTQIQMVTNSSKENMRELAQYANQAAQALGSTTVDYTNAVKVFVQEGFSEAESKQYANLSTKLANVSEQDTATTSDQITAYRNAFQLDYQQTVEAMDKVANVANNTASNVNELMTASQRSASVAQAVGATQDSFLASLATIQSVTRQTAEEIGNGMKTIYQRLADIRLGGETEDGVDYGKYANTLKQVGVDVLDAAGEFKGMDEIFKELMAAWKDMSRTQQIAVGETVAGKFQYNRFAALMNNADYYEKSLDATQNASGMMDQMNDYYMESIEGKLKTLQAAGEQVMSTLFDQDAVEPVLDNVIALVNGLNDMVEAAGGLNGVLTALSGVMLRTFSTQIAGTINNIASSFGLMIANTNNAKNFSNVAASLGLIGSSSQNGSLGQKLVSGVANNYDSLSVKSKEKLEQISKQIVVLDETRLQLTQKQRAALQPIISTATKEMQLRQESGAALKQEINDLQKKYSAGKISTATYNEQLKLLQDEKKTLEQQTSQYAKAEQAAARLTQALENGETNISDQVKRVKDLARELQVAGFNAAELDNLIKEAEIAASNESNMGSVVDDMLETTDLESRINNVTKLIGNVTSLAFGVSMVTEAVRVLGDESATFEDKFNAVVMNGLMGLTMMAPAIIDATKAMKGLTLATIAETIAQKARAAATAIANAAAMHPGALAAIIAITAAIAAAVIIYEAITHEARAANEEFERQKDILADVKKTYSDAKEGFESLHNSIKSVSDLQSSLKNMTKGTNEWTEATRQLNDEVLNLLQTYPELAQYVTNKDGVLSIDENELNTFYDKQMQQVQHLGGISSTQQIATLTAENKKLIQDFAQKWQIDPKQIEEAIQQGSIELVGESQALNSAFADLTQKVQTNSLYIDKLNDTIGTVGLNSTNYVESRSQEEINEEAKQQILDKYGYDVPAGFTETVGPYGEIISTPTEAGKRLGINNNADNEDFKEALSAAFGKTITDINYDLLGNKYNLSYTEGEEEKEKSYSYDEILDRLVQSQGVLNETTRKVEGTKEIFEEFGATWDEETRQFKDASGNVITSLEELGNVAKEQADALASFASNDKFQSFMTLLYGSEENFKNDVINNYGDKDVQTTLADRTAAFESYSQLDEEQLDRLKEKGIDSLDKFAEAINKGTINIDNLAASVEALDQETTGRGWIDREDTPTNLSGQAFTNRIDIGEDEDSQEQLKQLLDDIGMNERSFSKMSSSLYNEEDGYFQNQKEELEAAIAALESHKKITEEDAAEIAKLKDELDDLSSSAEDITAMMLRSGKGVAELTDEFEELAEILGDSAQEGTAAWYEALSKLDEHFSDILNIDAGTLTDEFLSSGEALDYARRMAEGDLTAIDDLRAAASEDIIQHLEIIATDNFPEVAEAKNQLLAELKQFQADLDAGTITATADLDTHPFIIKLNELLEAGSITAEQATNVLSSMGVEAEIKHATEDGFMDETHYDVVFGNPEKASYSFGEGSSGEMVIPTFTIIPRTVKKPTTIDIPYIQGSQYTGPGVSVSSYTPPARSFSGGGGGKSSSPKSSTPKESKPKVVKPKEYATSEWDYLTDITNDLNRASAAMEKLTKLEDRLFGASKISNLQKLKQEYAGYISLLQQEVSLAKSHANRLRTQAYDENGNLTMNAYAGNAGVGYLHFDSKGNLENGREIELALLNKLNNATAAYNANRYDEDNSGWYSDRVDDAQKNYDGFMKAMQEYQDTLGKIEEGENQIQEYQQKIQDAADEIIDSIQEGIEGIIEAIDSQRDWDRMYRNWMEGGNGYSHFASDQKYYEEGLESLFSKTIGGNKSVIDLQLENLQNRIGDVKNVFDGDSSNADKEKLSEQAAQENLREAIDNLTDNIEKAVDYYDSLIETIEEASSKMDELIDSRLGEYDSIYDYLDTRLDQYKMLNSQEYAGQAQLYGKQIETNLQKLVDINTSIEAKQATVKSLEKLEASGKTLSTEEREALKEAREKVNALQKDQLETESKILSTVKNKLEAETRQSVKELQNAIMGGEDFEWAKQQWELASKMSSRYLDDYNRAYEVQKIQLQYQQLLNSTQETELATRQKITAEMNNQLKYLREKENLSAYDIQRAQGELELLQRKIALEEAYNNKSQMQLQRNAAGNYDFVYTADEDNVLSSMQALMEKEQELYNLSKSRQEELRQDFYDFVTEMGEMIIETATNMDIAAEERDIRVKEMLNSLSEYMITIDEETTMAQVDLYNSFVDASEIITEENVGKLQDVFDRMAEATAAIREAIGNDLDGIQQHHSDTSDAIDQRTEDGFIKIQSGSNSTKSVLTDDLNKILENFDGTFNSIDATTSNSFANISNNMNSAYESVRKTSEDKLAKIDADTKLHMDSADTKIREVVTNVSTTIDEKTEHIKTKSIASTEEVQKAIDKASIDISTSVKNAERDTKEALKAAGDSFNTFVKSSINNATLRLAVLDATTRTFASDLRTLNSVISSCSSQISTWRNAISNAMYQANSFISSGNSLMQSLYNIGVQAGYATSDFYDLANAIQYAAACMADLNGMSYSSPSYSSYDYGGGGYGGGGGYSQEAYDAAYRIWMYGDPGGGGYWYDQGVSMYGQSLADEILSLFNSGYGYEWMDTGGYTGTWNVGESLRQSGGGKLAVLHQKELVLNPEDTENMLSAVSVVRDIVSGLNNVTKVPSSNLNRQSPIGDNIEQRVSINATFPGVSEAIEIKQALEQLADDAYQVANQYKY